VPREQWCTVGEYYSSEDQALRVDEFQRLIVEFRSG